MIWEQDNKKVIWVVWGLLNFDVVYFYYFNISTRPLQGSTICKISHRLVDVQFLKLFKGLAGYGSAARGRGGNNRAAQEHSAGVASKTMSATLRLMVQN